MNTLSTQQTQTFEQVSLCPHCLSIAEVRPVADEHFLFCTDGCGCLEGWRPVEKFECSICKELHDEPECDCTKPTNLYAVTHSILTAHRSPMNITYYLKAKSHWGAIMESYRKMKEEGRKWFRRPKSICYQTNIT